MHHSAGGPSTSKAAAHAASGAAEATPHNITRIDAPSIVPAVEEVPPAPVPISVRLSRGAERRRDADWDPEEYYTASGPVYRTSKGGRAAGPSAELVGMLPVRDRGCKGVTGGASNVTVDVVAPVATLERAAAAIVASSVRHNEVPIGSSGLFPASAHCEVHTANAAAPSGSRRKKGKSTFDDSAGRTGAPPIAQGGAHAKKRTHAKQKRVTAGEDSNKRNTIKQGATQLGNVRKGVLAAAAAAYACTLKPGEAVRAFAFQVLAAAVSMHEERNALVRVMGQAETLDLSHTPCIGMPSFLTRIGSLCCISCCHVQVIADSTITGVSGSVCCKLLLGLILQFFSTPWAAKLGRLPCMCARSAVRNALGV